MYHHHHQVLNVDGHENVLESGLGFNHDFNHDGVVKPGGSDGGDIGGTRPGR